MFEVTPSWKTTYPEAHVGVLVMRDVSNPPRHPAMESRKTELEEHLHLQFSGQDRSAIASHPVLRAYADYYRQFKKTYHIQLQLESIQQRVYLRAILLEILGGRRCGRRPIRCTRPSGRRR